MTDRDGTRARAQCHDDFFWMMATVAAEHKDGDALTRMVTNDRMRDHWHKLLGKRPFLRWSSSQIIRCVHLNSRGVRAFPRKSHSAPRTASTSGMATMARRP